ncbi:GNAT family N-acetyltransferase [Solirubrobacter soli]|uniref:GNAT family N-acetyltransferase n=1 Tax=Solirubrobacter soli TaxID=363832 RepID=UPI0003F4E530|nr:GNAT family N-acetyltransferase [Solirubrobacter soli]
MIIDHVRAGDAERMKALRLRALQEDPQGFSSTYERELTLPEEWWTSRAALSDAGEVQRMYIAREGERWLGMALARDDDGTAVLNAMWVAPEGRGRGAARALCDACAEWASTHGFAVLEVGVFPDNEARRMYEAVGFAPDREEDGILIFRRTL